jgi:hypothetical protein
LLKAAGPRSETGDAGAARLVALAIFGASAGMN